MTALAIAKTFNVIESLQFMSFQPTTYGLIDATLNIKKRYRISYWDSAIISAAKLLGCAIVYSEDLNHGQIYSEVQVINPFRE